MSNPGFMLVAGFLFILGFFGFGASFGAMNEIGLLIALAAGSALWGMSLFLLVICRRQYKLERAQTRASLGGFAVNRRPRGGFGKGALLGLVASVVLAALTNHLIGLLAARLVLVVAIFALPIIGGLMLSLWRATSLRR